MNLEQCGRRRRKGEAEESIYNLVPRPKLLHPRPPVSMSKYREKARCEMEAPKDRHRTMGYEKTPLRGVDCFLKAHEKEPILPPKQKFVYPDAARKRPNIPKINDIPHLGYKTKKDFIVSNAVDNINSIPGNPHRIYVDTRIGDKNLLDPSGLVPKYVAKKTYGKIPPYIHKKNVEMREAKEQYSEYVKELFGARAAPVLPETERQRIVDGLKTNWEKANHEFLALPMILDTISKEKRKERLERLMAQLERDIDLIESHKTIYVK